jgi:hypothetical protein
MPTYSVDPLYPHWFRCDLCGKDVAPVYPAEPLDLVNLTAGQVLDLCPDIEAHIEAHEHGCPLPGPADPPVDEARARLHGAGWTIGETATASGWHPARTNPRAIALSRLSVYAAFWF